MSKAVDDHENQISGLLREIPTLVIWLDQMRGLATSGDGRTVMLGLSAEETIEFMQLYPIVNADILHGAEDRAGEFEFDAHVERYNQLREMHDEARSEDAVQNTEHWDNNSKPQ